MIPTHLNRAQRQALWHILKKHSVLFSGKLGKLPCKPVHLELTDPNAKPYHGKPYQIPRVLLPLLKKEVERLCEIGVLCKTNNSEWAAQGFAVPKKNKQIRFVTDFCMLNRFLHRYPFPLPSIQEIMHTVDGLTFVSVLDLNMGPPDSGQSSSTKKVNNSQQSSSPGASILTNAVRWDYLSAPISIKRICQQSFLTWKM
jgi:hypothetical protein